MTSNPYTYTVSESSGTDLRVVLFRYLRNWKWFAASLVVALAAGYIYLQFQVPLYKVQSSLLIKDEKKGISEDNILKEMDLFAPKKVVENEVEILKSYTLMDKVIRTLGINVTYFRDTRVGKREIYEQSPIRLLVEQASPALHEAELHIDFVNASTVRINEMPYPVNQSVQTPYGRLRVFPKVAISDTTRPIIVTVAPQQMMVQRYMEKMKVEPTSKASTVLMLSMEEAVPRKGEDILNKLIDEYNAASLLDKNKVASNTLRFIEERLGLIARELATVEKDVEVYKSTQGITDISTESRIFLENVQRNDAQLNEVNIQLSALNDIERYIRSTQGERAPTPATLGLSDPVLLSLITKVNELELHRENLSRTTSMQNPLLASLDEQIRSTKTNIDDNIQTMKRILTGTRSRLVSANGKFENMIRTVPGKERALLDITRQQAIKNNLYTYLLGKREETALSYASAVSDSRTIDVARSSSKPVKPVSSVIFLLFAAFGVLLPVGAIAMRDMLHDRISSRLEVEEATHAPILGEIARTRNKAPLVVTSRSRSVIAEQIRAIRTNLQFLRTDNKSLTLLFTSSISGEGKSFVSLNLGASLALIDRPTVILEMDLRKPKLHSMIGVPNAIGISNYLIGQASLDQIIQAVPDVPNYFIITSGPVPPNPAELLLNGRLETLFAELRERFEFIIIDSPPVGLVTDAQLMADQADATIYVVRHEVTPKPHLKTVEMLYKEQRFRKLSLVINSVEQGQRYGYGYASSYGGYGYGGYAEEEESESSNMIGRLISRK
ncbi:GumC family protein [Tellurirhabdus rosea]|uniref:GumC family protein n=1 Tax=Tellurirhabdus rosea TaxID=2674997 RepID=UPI0022542591|nr:tyrosine-protein kinase [Tellurirhabdus rosea]